MTPPPRLAVHVGRQDPGLLADVLTAAAPWCEAVAVAAHEAEPPGIVAHLYVSEVYPARPRQPCAVWRLPGSEPVESSAAVVLGEAGVVDPAGVDLLVCGVAVPSAARLVLPFTRGRYRELRGLPDRMVADHAGDRLFWGAPGMPDTPARPPSWPTLAALAGAVVAIGDAAWTALAWGCPTVTDGETVQRLALVPGEHVLVGADPEERRVLAAGLAGDDVLAAGLGQRGWRTVQHRRPAGAAEELCRRLGLGARRDVAAPARLTAALDSLGTPPDALVRFRARAAVEPLPGAATQGWHPPERKTHVDA